MAEDVDVFAAAVDGSLAHPKDVKFEGMPPGELANSILGTVEGLETISKA